MYVCDLCNVRCTCEKDLQVHQGGKKHAQVAAAQKSRPHEGLQSPEPSPWQCRTCQLPFSSAEALTRHNLSKSHGNRAHQWLRDIIASEIPVAQREKSEPWRCHICDVMCTGQNNLQMHVDGLKHKAKLRELSMSPQEVLYQPSGDSQDTAGAEFVPTARPERPRPPAAVYPGGLGFYAQWPPPESTRSQPAGGQGGAPPGFRYPEGESPGLGRREAPVKDEDQEFLDELLGITPGPAGGGGVETPAGSMLSTQQPATPTLHGCKPSAASDASLEGSDDRHHANGLGGMPLEDIIQIINKFFYCSLTKAVMVDPVVACDGYTYEREAIEAWMKHNRYSPITKEPLSNRRVMPNLIIKQATINFQNHGQLSEEE